MEFAINHMAVPSLTYDVVIGLAARLRCAGVEFRNDISGPLFGGADPAEVARVARDNGIRILALAEVKAFNDFTPEKRSEAATLIETAAACGAEAISLIPRADGLGLGNGERQANLRLALRELRPLLDEKGLLGYVEPLGFDVSSLRFKQEAIDAIEGLGAASTYKLIHDTFHHYVAGETAVFAEYTGLVHVSGVIDKRLAPHEMRDEHRVLVDHRDRLGNIEQLQALREGGFDGPVSFEPFSPDIHALTDPRSAISASTEFIDSNLTASAA